MAYGRGGERRQNGSGDERSSDERGRDREARRSEEKKEMLKAWEPKTTLGKEVKAGKVTSISQIFHSGRKIEEPEIIDVLLPNLKDEVIEIGRVQRMTKNNRKMKFRIVAIVGDGNGHVGIGAGKDIEVKAAIQRAVENAKDSIIPVLMGCGSWQCGCGTHHSIPVIVRGQCSGTTVILKPAPRGLGIVASKPVKKMLELAGINDIWSFSKGTTKSRYNTLMAVYRALGSMNKMKNTGDMKLGAIQK